MGVKGEGRGECVRKTAVEWGTVNDMREEDGSREARLKGRREGVKRR